MVTVRPMAITRDLSEMNQVPPEAVCRTRVFGKCGGSMENNNYTLVNGTKFYVRRKPVYETIKRIFDIVAAVLFIAVTVVCRRI